MAYDFIRTLLNNLLLVFCSEQAVFIYVPILRHMVLKPSGANCSYTLDRNYVRSDGVIHWENLSDVFFDNYLANPIIGTEESISAFTREEVLKYREQFCSLDQAIVVISGDMKKKDAVSIMQKYFGKANGRIKNHSMMLN